MKNKDQKLLEEAYKSIQEQEMGSSPTSGGKPKRTGPKIKLVRIEQDEKGAGYEQFPNQGGSVHLLVNGKPLEAIIHPSGELDFEGDLESIGDEEMIGVQTFLFSDPRVVKAFPLEDF